MPLQLLIVSSLMPTRTRPDVGVFVVRQAQLLMEQGVEVRIITPRLWLPPPLGRFTQWPELGERAVSCPDPIGLRRAYYFRPPGGGFTRFEGLAKQWPVSLVARRWHAERAFDVVLGVDMTADAVAAVHTAQALQLPVANLAIGSDVMVRPHTLPGLSGLLGRTLAATDLPVAVSESVCQVLRDTRACRREPLCVYLGRPAAPALSDSERAALRKQLGFGPEHVVAVYLGRLTREKGMAELLAATGQLTARQRNVRVLAIGEGPFKADLNALNTNAHEPVVFTPGRMPSDAVMRHLHAADFMVFPSHSEGLPQAVLEAMDMGLPVVATRVGGVPEAVVHEYNGLLVPAKDTAALTAAMERMSTDRALRQRAGKNSLARARSVFDSAANAKRLADALRALEKPRRN